MKRNAWVLPGLLVLSGVGSLALFAPDVLRGKSDPVGVLLVALAVTMIVAAPFLARFGTDREHSVEIRLAVGLDAATALAARALEEIAPSSAVQLLRTERAVEMTTFAPEFARLFGEEVGVRLTVSERGVIARISSRYTISTVFDRARRNEEHVSEVVRALEGWSSPPRPEAR